jgi:hypothetical protein
MEACLTWSRLNEDLAPSRHPRHDQPMTFRNFISADEITTGRLQQVA